MVRPVDQRRLRGHELPGDGGLVQEQDWRADRIRDADDLVCWRAAIPVSAAGSPSWLRDNVARLGPEYRRPDRAWHPGDAAQRDLWSPPARIPLADRTAALLQVLVITVAHSRSLRGG